MSAINDGGSAFPRERIIALDSRHVDPVELKKQVERIRDELSDGLTLRDYFAAKAMQADLSAGVSENTPDVTMTLIDLIARNSYRMADAMLKARGDA